MTAHEDDSEDCADLEAQADELLAGAAAELTADPDDSLSLASLSLASCLPVRNMRSYRACYVCVEVKDRMLTAREETILRIIGTALLEARAWIGSTNAWLTTEDGLLDRLEFRTLAPLPNEQLACVEVLAPSRRGPSRHARAVRKTTRRGS